MEAQDSPSLPIESNGLFGFKVRFILGNQLAGTKSLEHYPMLQGRRVRRGPDLYAVHLVEYSDERRTAPQVILQWAGREPP